MGKILASHVHGRQMNATQATVSLHVRGHVYVTLCTCVRTLYVALYMCAHMYIYLTPHYKTTEWFAKNQLKSVYLHIILYKGRLISTHMHTRMHVYSAHMYLTHTCIHTCMYAHCTHVPHTYIHTCMYTVHACTSHIHAYTHACI